MRPRKSSCAAVNCTRWDVEPQMTIFPDKGSFITHAFEHQAKIARRNRLRQIERSASISSPGASGCSR